MTQRATKTFLNPEGLHTNPAYSQAVVVEHPAKTIYVGGQNAVDAAGEVVGTTLGEQTAQVLRNLQVALAAAGAEPTDVVHWRIAVAQGQDVVEGFAAFQQVWGLHPDMPAISVSIVAGLADPRFLCEIDAVAAV